MKNGTKKKWPSHFSKVDEILTKKALRKGPRFVLGAWLGWNQLDPEGSERGLNQSDLARLLEVTPGHLNSLFRGDKNRAGALARWVEELTGIPAKSWFQD